MDTIVGAAIMLLLAIYYPGLFTVIKTWFINKPIAKIKSLVEKYKS